jgi:magnesium transporter
VPIALSTPGRCRARPATTPRRISVIAYTHEAVTETEGKTLEEALAAAGPGTRWINIDGADAPLLQQLGAHFRLHPLALEDVLTGPQRPKVERYADHFFMILRMLRCTNPGRLDIDDEQVCVFFGRDWVITIQERPGGDVFIVREALPRPRPGPRRGRRLNCVSAVDGRWLLPVLKVVSDSVEMLETETLNAAPRSLKPSTRHIVLTLQARLADPRGHRRAPARRLRSSRPRPACSCVTVTSPCRR